MKQSSQGQGLYEKMTETPIPRLIINLAIPTIISMLVTALYSMGDTYFVSKLGTSASGAVGIVFALMAIIQSFGFMFGQGAASLISRSLGAKEYDRANTLAASSFFASLVFGLLITVLGLIFMDPLLKLLGATPTIIPYARQYVLYILLGAPVLCSSYVLNNILRSEGKAAFAMIGITVGGILNLFLDPLLIFVFKMGIAGAGCATLISQVISLLLLLSMFWMKKSAMHLHIKYISRTADWYWKITALGLPSFLRQGLASLATAILNVQAAPYGDAAISAMSINGRVFMVLFSIMIGFGQGFQPVAGHNYGARKYGRLREAILFCIKFGAIVLTALSIILFIFAPQVMAAFRADDREVIEIGVFAMRVQCLAMPLMPFSTISNMTFQIIGKSVVASVLSSARQGIFFLPLILILPPLMGIRGVQLTQPIADILTIILSIIFMVPFLKKLKNASNDAKEELI